MNKRKYDSLVKLLNKCVKFLSFLTEIRFTAYSHSTRCYLPLIVLVHNTNYGKRPI